MISNYIHYSVGWNYLSIPNFKGATVEVKEYISNIIPHFTSKWLLIHAGIEV